MAKRICRGHKRRWKDKPNCHPTLTDALAVRAGGREAVGVSFLRAEGWRQTGGRRGRDGGQGRVGRGRCSLRSLLPAGAVGGRDGRQREPPPRQPTAGRTGYRRHGPPSSAHRSSVSGSPPQRPRPLPVRAGPLPSLTMAVPFPILLPRRAHRLFLGPASRRLCGVLPSADPPPARPRSAEAAKRPNLSHRVRQPRSIRLDCTVSCCRITP